MITKRVVADKIAAWLRHEITQAQLVACAEEAICEGDCGDQDAGCRSVGPGSHEGVWARLGGL